MRKSRQVFTFLSLAAITLIACGGEADFESVLRDQIEYLNEISPVLEGITDDASFKAAKPKIDSFLDKMSALKNKREKLGEPSHDAKKSLQKTGIIKDFTQAAQKFTQATFRLGTNDQLGKEAKETIKKLHKAMQM